jgi:glutaredoxin 3
MTAATSSAATIRPSIGVVILPPRVQLYTAPFCVNCERARLLLEHAGIAFEEIDLSRDLERCCALAALTGGRSVPQLVIDGRSIGGFDQLAALESSGGLQALTGSDSEAALPRIGESPDGGLPAAAQDRAMNGRMR